MHRLALVLLLASAPLPASAEPPETRPAEPLAVRRAVLFKNGLGFLTRTGRLELRSGWATLPAVPPASYGTLWVGVGGEGADEVVTASESRSEERPVTALEELLAVNGGRQATLELRGGRSVAGILREGMPGETGTGRAFLVLETGARFQVVPLAEVAGATFGEPPRATAPRTTTREVLRLRSGSRDGGAEVAVSSLEKGIGWTPRYQVRLEDGGRARLELGAVLVDDAADLADAEVLFAVGYPSFAFAEVPTPLDVRQSLAQFFQALRGGGFREAGALANVMTQTVVSAHGRPPALEGGYDSSTVADATQAEQDLFLYTRKGVTLRKGERGAYPLVTATVPFSHVYDWEVPPASEDEERGSRAPGGAPALDQVWHSLRLENVSRFPWTTGPALVTAASGPVAQGTLNYTARGASTLLRLTVAPDVAAEREEREVARVAGALRRFGSTWDALTIEGTLRVTSRRAEAIDLSIRRTVQGTVSSAGEGGKETRLGSRPSALNPASRLDWSVRLEPGVPKTITYRYTVHVRG